MERQPPLSLFKSRIYDLLKNRDKLAPVSPIGGLSPADSALCTNLSLAAEAFQDQMALDIAETAFDGIALTLLTIYRDGLPPGGKLANPNMQQVAEILAEAGRHARDSQSTGAHEADSSAEERRAAGDASYRNGS